MYACSLQIYNHVSFLFIYCNLSSKIGHDHVRAMLFKQRPMATSARPPIVVVRGKGQRARARGHGCRGAPSRHCPTGMGWRARTRGHVLRGVPSRCHRVGTRPACSSSWPWPPWRAPPAAVTLGEGRCAQARDHGCRGAPSHRRPAQSPLLSLCSSR
jgi:hypothetical protein